jgi:hypothetical protein
MRRERERKREGGRDEIERRKSKRNKEERLYRDCIVYGTFALLCLLKNFISENSTSGKRSTSVFAILFPDLFPWKPTTLSPPYFIISHLCGEVLVKVKSTFKKISMEISRECMSETVRLVLADNSLHRKFHIWKEVQYFCNIFPVKTNHTVTIVPHSTEKEEYKKNKKTK